MCACLCLCVCACTSMCVHVSMIVCVSVCCGPSDRDHGFIDVRALLLCSQSKSM